MFFDWELQQKLLEGQSKPAPSPSVDPIVVTKNVSMAYLMPLVVEAAVDVAAVVNPDAPVNTRVIQQDQVGKPGQGSYEMKDEDEVVRAVRKAFRQGSPRQVRQVLNVCQAQYPNTKINLRALNKRKEQ
jgi:hypothetical protein